MPTEHQMTAYRLHRGQGLDQAEAAAVMGITRTNFNRLYKRAERRLRALRLLTAQRGGDMKTVEMLLA
jgi:predicted DNA-binding protein (UPF0251 family)